MDTPIFKPEPAPCRPMRVCFVIDRLSRAGTELQLLLLVKQLDRTRVTPFLCLLDGYDDTSESLLPRDCPSLRLGIQSLRSAKALQQSWKFWRFLRSERIDIVQTYLRDSTRFAAPIAKAAGVRAVFGARRNIGHCMSPIDSCVARLYNRYFIDKIIANCAATKAAAIEQERVSPDKVLVLHNCLDLTRFSHIPPWTPGTTLTPRRIGMVGNLKRVKGPDLFIRAAEHVLKIFPHTHFAIAGVGDTHQYMQLIDDLRLGSNVRLLGEVMDVPAFLSTLDMAVLPSRAEGLSNALLEYMAAGRPVVATDVGGNADLIGTHCHKACLAACDVHAIARRIISLQSDDTLASSTAQHLRKRAQQTTVHSIAHAHALYSTVPPALFADAGAPSHSPMHELQT